LAGVSATIREGEDSVAVLFAVLVATFILGTIRPLFNASTMLFVFTPLTHVEGTIGVLVRTMAVSFVI
jgi:hypothetical protein